MKYKRVIKVKLPTDKGHFDLIAYEHPKTGDHHLALVKGNVSNKKGVLTRIHSSCVTGDIFGSHRCDCGPQLVKAINRIEEEGCGIVLYLFQEGRGIGLINKLKAYKLQEEGLDTVEANLKLGLPADLRNYEVAKDILDDLSVSSIKLLTNNPDKIDQMKNLGVIVEKREACEIEPVEFNKFYLETKKNKMGHFLFNNL